MFEIIHDIRLVLRNTPAHRKPQAIAKLAQLGLLLAVLVVFFEQGREIAVTMAISSGNSVLGVNIGAGLLAATVIVVVPMVLVALTKTERAALRRRYEKTSGGDGPK